MHQLFPDLPLHSLAQKMREKRGSRGLREVAKEIGVGHATVARFEKGHSVEIETFQKFLRWLGADPEEALASEGEIKDRIPVAHMHFRKKAEVGPRTAKALAELILHAQRALQTEEL